MPTDYYSTFGKYLGTWGIGPARRVIDEARYRQLIAQATTTPTQAVSSDFAISFPKPQGGWLLTREEERVMGGLEYQVHLQRVGRLSANLLRYSRELRIDPAGASHVLQAMYADAKKVRKERGTYIMIVKSGNVFQVQAERAAPRHIIKASSGDIQLGMRRYPRGSPLRYLAFHPSGFMKQVIATVHTHIVYGKPEPRGLTQGRTVVQMGRVPILVHGVSKEDIDAAVHDKFVIYALDDSYIHRANARTGKVFNKLSRKLDVLVDALEIYGGKRQR